MDHLVLTIKAFRIRNRLRLYQRQKENSIRAGGEVPILNWSDKYFQFVTRTRKKIRNACFVCCPPNSRLYKFGFKLRRDGTFENFVMKSFVGFLGGILLTYIFFMFFVFQLNFTLSSATVICFLLGLMLSIGLAFSHKVRCFTFLLLPVFFSKRGRQALMAYAFILALTGPAKNTLHNMGVLSESLACGQEQLKQAAQQIVNMIKQPFYAIRDAIRKIMDTVKQIIAKIKEALLTIQRIVLGILNVIKTAVQWLGSVVSICNKKVGTPFQRCMRVMDAAVLDCQAKLGPLFSWLCSITYIGHALCYVVKFLDFICMLFDFIGNIGSAVVQKIKRKLREFMRHIRTIFFISIDFNHSFHFESNQSRTMQDVTSGMITEIKHKTDRFLMLFDWMSFAFSFFFLFILFRVWHYRHKFLTSDSFDNHYIRTDFRLLDLRRAKMEQETVLPLNHRERRKYIRISSVRLVQAERTKLAKSFVFLAVTSVKLLIHLCTDYCLYWVLAKIRFYGRFQTAMPPPNMVNVHVEGKGVLSDLYRSTVNAFSPMGAHTEVDTMPCLPDPLPPNKGRYIQIVSLIAMCWILAMVEPYGLRIRNVVMCFYHPDRAQQRTVWLYNNIIRARGNFLKFSRRLLRRVAKGREGDGPQDKVTLKERLRAVCPLLNRLGLLGKSKEEACLLCGNVARENDAEQLIHCSRPGCVGVYCKECYADLQNLCTICMEPIEYGDPSDMSFEKDSSDEGPSSSGRRYNRRKSPGFLERRNHKRDDDVEKKLLDSSTEGSSSNLSFGYQNEDTRHRSDHSKYKQPFRDVEKQANLNLASLQDLRQAKRPDLESEEDAPTSKRWRRLNLGRHINWRRSQKDNEGKSSKWRLRRKKKKLYHEDNERPTNVFRKFVHNVFKKKRSNGKTDTDTSTSDDQRALLNDESTSESESPTSRYGRPEPDEHGRRDKPVDTNPHHTYEDQPYELSEFVNQVVPREREPIVVYYAFPEYTHGPLLDNQHEYPTTSVETPIGSGFVGRHDSFPQHKYPTTSEQQNPTGSGYVSHDDRESLLDEERDGTDSHRDDIGNEDGRSHHNEQAAMGSHQGSAMTYDNWLSLQNERNTSESGNVWPGYDDGRVPHNEHRENTLSYPTPIGSGHGTPTPTYDNGRSDEATSRANPIMSGYDPPIVYEERRSLLNNDYQPMSSELNQIWENNSLSFISMDNLDLFGVSPHETPTAHGNVSFIDRENEKITSNYNNRMSSEGNANVPTIPKHNQLILNTYYMISSEPADMGKDIFEDQRAANSNKDDNQVSLELKEISSLDDNSYTSQENRPTLSPTQMSIQPKIQYEADVDHLISLPKVQEPSEYRVDTSKEREAVTLIYGSSNSIAQDPPVIWFVRKKETTHTDMNKSPKSADDIKGALISAMAFADDHRSTQHEDANEMTFSGPGVMLEEYPTDIVCASLQGTLTGSSSIDVPTQQQSLDKSSNIHDAGGSYYNVEIPSIDTSPQIGGGYMDATPQSPDRTCYTQYHVILDTKNPFAKPKDESIERKRESIGEKHGQDEVTNATWSSNVNVQTEKKRLDSKIKDLADKLKAATNIQKVRGQFKTKTGVTDGSPNANVRTGRKRLDSKIKELAEKLQAATNIQQVREKFKTIEKTCPRDRVSPKSTRRYLNSGVELATSTSVDARNIPSKRKQWSLDSTGRYANKQRTVNSTPKIKPRNDTSPRMCDSTKPIQKIDGAGIDRLNERTGDQVNGRGSFGLQANDASTTQRKVVAHNDDGQQTTKTKAMPSYVRSSLAISDAGNNQPSQCPKNMSSGQQTKTLKTWYPDHIPPDHVNSYNTVVDQLKGYFLCRIPELPADHSNDLDYENSYDGSSEPSVYGKQGQQTSRKNKSRRERSSSSECISEESLDETGPWEQLLPRVGQKSRGRKSKKSGGSLDGYLPSDSSEGEDFGRGGFKSKDKAKELETLKKQAVESNDNLRRKTSAWMLRLAKTIQQKFSNEKEENFEESRDKLKRADSIKMKKILPSTSNQEEFNVANPKRQYSKASTEVGGVETNVGNKKLQPTSRLPTSTSHKPKIQPREERTLGEIAIEEVSSNVALVAKSFANMFSPMMTKLTSYQTHVVPQPSGTTKKPQNTQKPEHKTELESTVEEDNVYDSPCSEEYNRPESTQTDYARNEDEYTRKPLTSEEYQTTSTQATDSDCQQAQTSNYPEARPEPVGMSKIVGDPAPRSTLMERKAPGYANRRPKVCTNSLRKLKKYKARYMQDPRSSLVESVNKKRTDRQNKCVCNQTQSASSTNGYDTVVSGVSNESSPKERHLLAETKANVYNTNEYSDLTQSSSPHEADDSGEDLPTHKKSLEYTETLPTTSNDVPNQMISSSTSHAFCRSYYRDNELSTSDTPHPFTETAAKTWSNNKHDQNVPSMSTSRHDYDTPYTTDNEVSISEVSLISNSTTRPPSHGYDSPYTTDVEFTTSDLTMSYTEATSKTYLVATHAQHHVATRTCSTTSQGYETDRATDDEMSTSDVGSPFTDVTSKKCRKANQTEMVPCQIIPPRVEYNTPCYRRDELLSSAANTSFYKRPVSRPHTTAQLHQVNYESSDHYDMPDSEAISVKDTLPLTKRLSPPLAITEKTPHNITTYARSQAKSTGDNVNPYQKDSTALASCVTPPGKKQLHSLIPIRKTQLNGSQHCPCYTLPETSKTKTGGPFLDARSSLHPTVHSERACANAIGVRNEPSTCVTLDGIIKSTPKSPMSPERSTKRRQQTATCINDIPNTFVDYRSSNPYRETCQQVPGRRSNESETLPYQSRPSYGNTLGELQCEQRLHGQVRPPSRPPTRAHAPPDLLLPQRSQSRNDCGAVQEAAIGAPISSVARAVPDDRVLQESNRHGYVSRAATTASPEFKNDQNEIRTDNVEHLGYRGRHFLSLLRKTKHKLRKVPEREEQSLWDRPLRPPSTGFQNVHKDNQSYDARPENVHSQFNQECGTMGRMSHQSAATHTQTLEQLNETEREHVVTLQQTGSTVDHREQQSGTQNNMVERPHMVSSMHTSHEEEMPSFRNDNHTGIQQNHVNGRYDRQDDITSIDRNHRRPTAENEYIQSSQDQHRTPVSSCPCTPIQQHQPVPHDNRQDHSTEMSWNCREYNAGNDQIQAMHEQHRTPPRTDTHSPIRQHEPVHYANRHDQITSVSADFGQRTGDDRPTRPAQEQHTSPPPRRATCSPIEKCCPIHSRQRCVEINFVPANCRRHSTGNEQIQSRTEQHRSTVRNDTCTSIQQCQPVHYQQRSDQFNFPPENYRRHPTGNEQTQSIPEQQRTSITTLAQHGQQIHSEQRHEQDNFVSGNCTRHTTGNEQTQSLREQQTLQNQNYRDHVREVVGPPTNSSRGNNSPVDTHADHTFTIAVKCKNHTTIARDQSLEYRMSPTPLETITEEEASTSSSKRRRSSEKVYCLKSSTPDLLSQ